MQDFSSKDPPKAITWDTTFARLTHSHWRSSCISSQCHVSLGFSDPWDEQEGHGQWDEGEDLFCWQLFSSPITWSKQSEWGLYLLLSPCSFHISPPCLINTSLWSVNTEVSHGGNCLLWFKKLDKERWRIGRNSPDWNSHRQSWKIRVRWNLLELNNITREA